ncbi:MAG: SAM-dependent methyltransferase [Bacteroidetes bacterium]|nr:SAM-dependent methyltransferase [Bacteroidota bacterium]
MGDSGKPGQDLPKGVGLTALNVARGRATETGRADRLFDDLLAQEFVIAATPESAESPEKIASQAKEGGTINIASILDDYVPIRTRFFDDYLRDACQAGCRQVVILAAGLDTRAFRLTWPQTVHIFELDLPDVFAFKERVLSSHHAAPACRRTIVPVDLREDWPAALLDAGFQPDEATAWLLEGILMYLTENERDNLLEWVGDLSTAGSRLALEPPAWTIPASLVPSLTLGVIDQPTMARLRALTVAARSDPSVVDLIAWLAGHGWRARRYSAKDQFTAYGRTLPPAIAAVLGATPRWLATAERAQLANPR